MGSAPCDLRGLAGTGAEQEPPGLWPPSQVDHKSWSISSGLERAEVPGGTGHRRQQWSRVCARLGVCRVQAFVHVVMCEHLSGYAAVSGL